MKKHFILFSTFAAWMLLATLLTACGEEVQELADNGNNGENITETTVGENCTLFSTGDDGTRTALGYDRKFYWSEGDQIYVNTDGANYKKTSSSTLSSDKRTADFVLEGVQLTHSPCSVMYIGNGTTAATATKNDLKVKIEAKQTQAAWGDTAHIGRSGDCGVAEATKVGGKYTFNLRHKASYLVLQPYRPTGNANPDWKLMKIEIIANGTTLAGTYDFGTGELVGTGSSNTIEFNCGTDGFDLNHTAASTANSCFAVIQPGQHELTIRYTVKVPGKENVYLFGSHGGDFGTMFFEKKIAARAYNPNVVTTIKHKMETNPHYQWDAVNPAGSATGTDYSTSLGAAQNSCKDMPNVNEMYWYVVNGNPHWDTATLWSIDGGLNVYPNGLWLKKKSTILAEGKTFRADIGKDGVDMRLTAAAQDVTPSTAVLPVADRSKYFFLPALGLYYPRFDINSPPANVRTNGYYWSSSPYPNNTLTAYYLSFNRSYVLVYGALYRSNSFAAGSHWFK